jgi:hypothetical protein
MLVVCVSIALVLAALLSGPAVGVAQQERNCADSSRRQAAIQVARAINSAQTAAYQSTGSYSRTKMDLPAVEGLVAKVVNGDDGKTYMVVIKDTLDPCRSVVFTDNEGMIYSAQPID